MSFLEPWVAALGQSVCDASTMLLPTRADLVVRARVYSATRIAPTGDIK